MNIRLRYDTSFTAGVHWLDKLYMTNYNVNLKLLTNCIDSDAQNLAMYRVKSMITEHFTNSVFINQNEQKQIKQYLSAGIKVTTIPEEPVDQVIGIMLFCKLNAVMEGRILVSELELTSELGDMIFYVHSEGETVGPFAEDGWWNNPEPVHNDITRYIKRVNDERIVEMQKQLTWKDYGFQWEPDDDSSESTVVYVDFPRKNENE